MRPRFTFFPSVFRYAPLKKIPKYTELQNEGQREIPIVFVKTDGKIDFSVFPYIDNAMPFSAMSSDTEKYDKNYNRWNVPLKLAFATTTHKMQGATCPGNCIT